MSEFGIRALCEPLEARRLLDSTAAAASVTSAADPFTVVVLPDTQKYVESFPSTFPAQTEWVADHRATEHVAFVTHVGDVVENGASGADRNLTEWQRADAAVDKLDAAALPYSVSLGNHDYDVNSSHAAATRFVEYFGAARYAGRTWYGGSSANQRNHYQIFDAAGRTFLNVNLQFEPTDADLAWAQGVVDSHPGTPVMLTTHSYLQNSSARSTSVDNADGNSGEQIFQKLVRSNPEIFLVVNGHFSGEGHRVVTNDAGLAVFEIVVDYQSRMNGGNGFLQLLQFDPAADKLDVKTYSPTLNQYETDANSQFSFNLDFDTRFNFAPPPPPGQRSVTFRQGLDGYSGSRDTMLRQATQSGRGPDSASGALAALQVDDDSPAGTGAKTQALLRFREIFAVGGGPIPHGSTIQSATLTLQVTDGGSGLRLHRMRTPWADGATWSGWTSGIQTDGYEAVAAPDATVGTGNSSANLPTGALQIDVTSSLRAWTAGEQNWGWALLPMPGGTNGVTFASGEATTAALRPQLSVTFTPPSTGTQGPPVPAPPPSRRLGVRSPLFRDILSGPLSILDMARLKRAGVGW